MILVSAALGGLGLACILIKRTVLGLLVGTQLLILGAAMLFIVAGTVTGEPVQGHVFAIFITLGGVSQLVAGYALVVRLFYLKKSVRLEEIQNLKH